MRLGEIQVVSSHLFALFGLGNRSGWFQQLLFYPSSSPCGEVIREATLNQPAFHCTNCQAVVLPGSGSAANAQLPEGFDVR